LRTSFTTLQKKLKKLCVKEKKSKNTLIIVSINNNATRLGVLSYLEHFNNGNFSQEGKYASVKHLLASNKFVNVNQMVNGRSGIDIARDVVENSTKHWPSFKRGNKIV